MRRQELIEALAGRCLDVQALTAGELAVVMRSYRRELATALDGRSLRVEVRVEDPTRNEKLLLMDDGRVVEVTDALLLDRPFEPHVRLTGRPQELLGVLFKEIGLVDAVHQGMLLSSVPIDSLAPLRDAVAAALASTLEE